jgi:iron(III) transport system substrate-binding protein
MMGKNLSLLAVIALVLGGPMLLRQQIERPRPTHDGETLVIVTPHNEATRFEFARAFQDSYRKKTGRTVQIDWRGVGGTSEISRFLASQFTAAFQNHWENKLGKPWTAAVQGAFDNPKAPSGDSARSAFLESTVGCGIDLFFGGGTFDFRLQSEAGRLVDSGIVSSMPELFGPGGIPEKIGGETYWDRQGRWVGACLGAFGICYNTDAIARLGAKAPEQWRDLANPVFRGEIALADPTQSGSVAKAFEMLIQQQMAEAQAAAAGWENAMRLIQRISANARYFTDGATRIPYDVEVGDAAAGMCIDFYGRFQSEAVRAPDGSSRLQYVQPRAGSSVGADPIGMLRGAPNPELAREFIGFVLSDEGQKLWNYKLGTPGGPVKYALRRLPIRPDFYRPELREFRSDPDVNPYEDAREFVYREEWTGALFRVIGFVVRAMCIDSHEELREAWAALISAGFPPEATAVFSDVSRVDYAAASHRIRETLRAPGKIPQAQLAREVGEAFREQYRRSAALARDGR